MGDGLGSSGGWAAWTFGTKPCYSGVGEAMAQKGMEETSTSPGCMETLEGEAMAQRVVVAGGGIVGAAFTYYLTRAGAQVTLLEREQPGHKTSNNSFAWVNAFSRTTRAYYDFARRSVEIYRRLPDELGIDMEFHWHGGIHWVDQPDAAEALRARVRELQSWGHAVEMISRDELIAR